MSLFLLRSVKPEVSWREASRSPAAKGSLFFYLKTTKPSSPAATLLAYWLIPSPLFSMLFLSFLLGGGSQAAARTAIRDVFQYLQHCGPNGSFCYEFLSMHGWQTEPEKLSPVCNLQRGSLFIYLMLVPSPPAVAHMSGERIFLVFAYKVGSFEHLRLVHFVE